MSELLLSTVQNRPIFGLKSSDCMADPCSISPRSEVLASRMRRREMIDLRFNPQTFRSLLFVRALSFQNQQTAPNALGRLHLLQPFQHPQSRPTWPPLLAFRSNNLYNFLPSLSSAWEYLVLCFPNIAEVANATDCTLEQNIRHPSLDSCSVLAQDVLGKRKRSPATVCVSDWPKGCRGN